MGAVTTELDPGRNLIIQKVTGELSLYNFIAAFKTATSHPDFTSGMNVLWDLTDASLAQVEIQDMHRMIEFIQFHIEKRGTGFKLAIVAHGKLEFGLSRMYEVYGEVLPFAKKAFYTMQEALDWLNS